MSKYGRLTVVSKFLVLYIFMLNRLTGSGPSAAIGFDLGRYQLIYATPCGSKLRSTMSFAVPFLGYRRIPAEPRRAPMSYMCILYKNKIKSKTVELTASKSKAK